ncbi:SH3 domain-containing protein [Chelativorans sp. AA-79]|uniref:SH3 domain-containing protein n=1 Tax=Chelativorans sp. AA-79 TaxID=3028735 RepID=UPI0023FA326C|nr:SH3 domain-containing protein [Chelativorans sp. AA-79]WEX12028.1 SH3 domain-containing protein [Chelativorans sp. AA-79]
MPAYAQDQERAAAEALKRGPSGLPLPRFVSLKSGRVNMRVGPGTQYAVAWLYLKPGLPVEIIQEYDNWRRVRDADGAEGWINQALLSGRRTAVVAPWFKGKERAALPLMTEPKEDSAVIAEVEPGVVGEVAACNGTWCRMNFAGHEGWISQEAIWGVYPGETVQE